MNFWNRGSSRSAGCTSVMPTIARSIYTGALIPHTRRYSCREGRANAADAPARGPGHDPASAEPHRARARPAMSGLQVREAQHRHSAWRAPEKFAGTANLADPARAISKPSVFSQMSAGAARAASDERLSGTAGCKRSPPRRARRGRATGATARAEALGVLDHHQRWHSARRRRPRSPSSRPARGSRRA